MGHMDIKIAVDTPTLYLYKPTSALATEQDKKIPVSDLKLKKHFREINVTGENICRIF